MVARGRQHLLWVAAILCNWTSSIRPIPTARRGDRYDALLLHYATVERQNTRALERRTARVRRRSSRRCGDPTAQASADGMGAVITPPMRGTGVRALT